MNRLLRNIKRPGESSLAALLALLFSSFLFSSYFYLHARARILETVRDDLTRRSQVAQSLSKLEERKLEAVARAILAGPILRGALTSRHDPTIQATIDDLRASNRLSGLHVEFGGKHYDSDGGDSLLHGAATDEVLAAPARVTASAAITQDTLAPWRDAVGAELLLHREGGAVSTTLNTRELAPGTEDSIPTLADGDTLYYATEVKLGEKAELTLLLPRQPYSWRYRDERNRFFFFGAIVVIGGYLLSLLAGRPASQGVAGAGAVSAEDWKRFLAELEALKKDRAP